MAQPILQALRILDLDDDAGSRPLRRGILSGRA